MTQFPVISISYKFCCYPLTKQSSLLQSIRSRKRFAIGDGSGGETG